MPSSEVQSKTQLNSTFFSSSFRGAVVKTEVALGTICLIGSVALLVLGSLHNHSLLLPGYTTSGSAGVLFILATLDGIFNMRVVKGVREAPQPRLVAEEVQLLLISKGIHIFEGDSLAIRVGEELYNYLLEQTGDTETPHVILGDAIYKAELDSKIPNQAIGLLTEQREQLYKTLGLEKSTMFPTFSIDPFHFESSKCAQKVQISVEIREDRDENFLKDHFFLGDFETFKNELQVHLKQRIVKNGQTFNFLYKNQLFVLKAEMKEEYCKFNFPVEIRQTEPNLGASSSKEDDSPTEMTIDAGKDICLYFPPIWDYACSIILEVTTKLTNKIVIPEEVLAKKLSKKIDSNLEVNRWVEYESFRIKSRQFSFHYKGEKINLAIKEMINKNTSVEVLIARASRQQLSMKLEDPFGQVSLEPNGEKGKTKDQSDNLVNKDFGKTRTKKHRNVDKEEQTLSITERMKKKGLAGLPEALNDALQPFIDINFDPEAKPIYSKWEKKLDRAILFYGPPGTGKTSIAREIGTMLGCEDDQIKFVSAQNILDSHVGATEKKIHALFEKRADGRFFVVIIDEIESLIPNKANLKNTWESNQVNQFQQEIDGFEMRDDFLLIGLTNYKEKIEPAMARRFTQKIEIGLPDKDNRKEIFKRILESFVKNSQVDETIDIEELADLTNGFSGAYIKMAFDEAKCFPLKEDLSACKSNSLHNSKLSQEHLKAAIEKVRKQLPKG